MVAVYPDVVLGWLSHKSGKEHGIGSLLALVLATGAPMAALATGLMQFFPAGHVPWFHPLFALLLCAGLRLFEKMVSNALNLDR